nr:hypothetical protein [uncultured Marinifilum sp.]
MGRNSTGAITTKEVIRIELSYLLKNGYIQKGRHISGSMSWTNDSNIGFESCYTNEELYLRLKYTNTNNQTGQKTKHDYKIDLIKIPSNLGKGDVLYFVCPATGKKCRILYKCYGSLTWKSREAYQRRIYYNTQSCSKYDYHNTRYWNINKELDRLGRTTAKSHYRNKPTRLMKRVSSLLAKQKYHDWVRWNVVSKSVEKLLH